MQQYGYKLNIKKTQRLIQEMGIMAIFPGPKTSIPSRDVSVFPYLLQGVAVTRVNQVWRVDITYIKLSVGTAYLFVLIRNFLLKMASLSPNLNHYSNKMFS